MASKSKSRRRVFRASCILAALIVAGSSFAWFTSRDEVTNRLSASANYGVSIVEDFQPPKNFLPGQKVNKDVAVVNTGNVDAFVRAWIDGEMSLVKREDNGDGTSVMTSNPGVASTALTTSPGFTATDSKQTKLTDINLNWYDTTDNTKYYRELSQKKSKNPENSTTDPSTTAPTTDNQPAYFSEVQSVQAGGVLVYHDPAAEFYYVLEQATTITDSTGETKTYPEGTYVGTASSKAASETGSVIIDPSKYYGEIDTSNFYPETEGLYLFRRNIELDDDANVVDDYEYTGYYFFKDTNNVTTTATADTADKPTFDKRTGYNPVYLALEYDNEHNNRSDYTLADTDVTTRSSDPTKDEYLPVTLNDVRLFTAKEHILKSYGTAPETLTWNFGAGATTYKLGTVAVTEGPTNTTTGSPDASAYSWKITAGGEEYWAGTQNGPYFKASEFSGVTPGTSYGSLTSTAGTPSTGDKVLYATYGTAGQDDYIKVNVQLANLNNSPDASTAETWSVIEDISGTDKKWTFYYNNDVEEGATTTKLIDSVELDKSVKDEAFLAFDFDLNVFMESVQVVLDEQGNESGDPVVEAWTNTNWAENQAASYNTNYTPATAKNNTTVTEGEITVIDWEKTT